ncbi:hypothetical protein EDB19DRAFT_2039289 [Suillus lakei]|nr:hypothetical protein EDB19DRAFT_2039289 [Suillus lakei]
MMSLAALLDVTPRSATALVEQCLAQIDKDTAALLESLRVLRSRRNALARISCLPPEILATVFKYVTDEESFMGPYNSSAPHCLVVTHVCRHWRQVALDCPALWASIDCVSARWLQIMLDRSKNTALVVTYSAQILQGCLERVLSQLPRIKVLRLSSSSYDVKRVFSCLSSHPAPLLQIFELSVTGTVNPISDTIFQGRAPQLRSVELMHCSFNWTSCIFSGLRTLVVRDARSVSKLSHLLSALSRMPDLEKLLLQRSIHDSGETKDSDKIPLSRLKHIALDDITIPIAVSLFAQLALPIDVKIAINLTGIVQGPQSLTGLFSAMDKNRDRFGSVIRSLCTYISHHTLGVQFSTSTACKSDYCWDPRDDDMRLSMQFEYNTTARDFQPAVVFDVCRMVTEHKIQTLSVSSAFCLPENFWRVGSADFPELKVIHLSKSSIGGLIAALRSKGTQNLDIAYPSLHALELKSVDFQDDEPESLRDVIAMRADHDGVHIHKLQVTMCRNLMFDQVQLLEEVVTDVDWDRTERSSRLLNYSCSCPICTWDDSESDLESDPDSDAPSED